MPALAELLEQGQVAQAAGRLDDARGHFQAALDADPNEPRAHFYLARVLAYQGHTDQALPHADQVVRLKPADPAARLQRADLLCAVGRADQAIGDYSHAIVGAPRQAPLYYRRGLALSGLRRHGEALADFDAAWALQPDNQTMIARGVMLQLLRRPDEAAAAFRHAAANDTANAQLHMALGHALMEAGDDEASVTAFDRAYQLAPDTPLLAGNRRYAKLKIADWRDYDADRDAILAGVARGIPTAAGLVAIESDPAQQQQCARLYARQAIPEQGPALWRQGARGHHTRLRLGYLSKDFREHATMILAAGLFEHHDRARFETFAFSTMLESGPWRARAEAGFEHFHNVETLTDRAIAELIRQLEIDILVDLDGFTIHSRLGVFGFRPAPMAVSFLGYPGTLGSPHFDAIIADRIVVPEDEQHFFDEQVIAMPVTYQPNTRRPDPAATPSRQEAGLPETGFVFCCFNGVQKIAPAMFDVWMQLLQRIPGSVLWLLGDGAALRANLAAEAEKRGVAAGRLIFAPKLDLPRHLARLALPDLFLDTLPYNAHTTASDALWCGLPVLTARGNSFPGRVAASLNHAIGMDEMTVANLADYESLAIALARDPALLAALKQRLVAARHNSALFDVQSFTRALEAAYLDLWKQHGPDASAYTV